MGTDWALAYWLDKCWLIHWDCFHDRIWIDYRLTNSICKLGYRGSWSRWRWSYSGQPGRRNWLNSICKLSWIQWNIPGISRRIDGVIQLDLVSRWNDFYLLINLACKWVYRWLGVAGGAQWLCKWVGPWLRRHVSLSAISARDSLRFSRGSLWILGKNSAVNERLLWQRVSTFFCLPATTSSADWCHSPSLLRSQ